MRSAARAIAVLAAALLLEQAEINRVILLRGFLGDMPEAEAIEFLLNRMQRAKTNKEFFATMAQA